MWNHTYSKDSRVPKARWQNSQMIAGDGTNPNLTTGGACEASTLAGDTVAERGLFGSGSSVALDARKTEQDLPMEEEEPK